MLGRWTRIAGTSAGRYFARLTCRPGKAHHGDSCQFALFATGGALAGIMFSHMSIKTSSLCSEAKWGYQPGPPKSRVVLLVIDVQNGFIKDGTKDPGATEPVVPQVVELVKRWLSVGGEVVVTRFDNSDPEGPFRLLKGMKADNWAKGSWKTQLSSSLLSALDGHDDKVWILDKSMYSCFTKEMCELRTKKGWTHIAICGFATDACVLKTAIDCFEMNIQSMVLKDACMTHRGRECHDAALQIVSNIVSRQAVVSIDGFLRLYNA